MKRLTVLALLATTAGCSAAPTMTIPDVTVTLSRAAGPGDSHTAVLTLTNDGTRSLTTRCGGFWLEGQTIEGWEILRSQTCIDPPPRVPLAPGEHRQVSFSYTGTITVRGAVRFGIDDAQPDVIRYTDPIAGSDPDVVAGSAALSAVIDAAPPHQFARGDSIPARFLNRSSESATVGALSCTAALERWQEHSQQWIRLESLRACIMLAVIVPPGEDYPFTVPPPDQPGRYRIVFPASIETGPSVTVQSAPFVVE